MSSLEELCVYMYVCVHRCFYQEANCHWKYYFHNPRSKWPRNNNHAGIITVKMFIKHIFVKNWASTFAFISALHMSNIEKEWNSEELVQGLEQEYGRNSMNQNLGSFRIYNVMGVREVPVMQAGCAISTVTTTEGKVLLAFTPRLMVFLVGFPSRWTFQQVSYLGTRSDHNLRWIFIPGQEESGTVKKGCLEDLDQTENARDGISLFWTLQRYQTALKCILMTGVLPHWE